MPCEIPSYLDIDAVVGACAQWDAQALHPGYGFLSENPALARACAAAGVTFIGPPPEAGELMGDKLRAKEAAARAGRPGGPELQRGRGADRGRRCVSRCWSRPPPAAAGAACASCSAPRSSTPRWRRRGARRKAGFGDDRVFIERFLPRARHLEVQVIADAHGNVLHLGERECSLQRRHQKVIEESPSPVVSPELRERARRRGGGPGPRRRLRQRRHGRVHRRLRGPRRALLPGDERAPPGRAPRHRAGHRPRPGRAPAARRRRRAARRSTRTRSRSTATRSRSGSTPRTPARASCPPPAACSPTPGRRHARACASTTRSSRARSSTPPTTRCWPRSSPTGPTAPQALARLDRALADFTVLGVTTTTRYLRGLLADDAVRAGELDTGLIERRGVPAGPIGDEGVAIAAAMLILADRAASAGDDPFDRVDGWRLGGERAASHWRLSVERRRARRGHRPARVRGDGEPARRRPVRDRGARRVAAGPRRRRDLDRARRLRPGRCARPPPSVAATPRPTATLRAPMPGQVLLVHAAAGDRVTAGDPLVVLESMKMELVLTAPVDGEVAELTVAVGDKVAVDQPLARVEAIAMKVLRSHANPGSEEFRANLDANTGAGRRPQRPAGARPAGRRRARPRAPRRPRQAAAARARGPPARPRRAVPGAARRWPPTASTTTRRPAPGSSPASAGSPGASA